MMPSLFFFTQSLLSPLLLLATYHIPLLVLSLSFCSPFFALCIIIVMIITLCSVKAPDKDLSCVQEKKL